MSLEALHTGPSLHCPYMGQRSSLFASGTLDQCKRAGQRGGCYPWRSPALKEEPWLQQDMSSESPLRPSPREGLSCFPFWPLRLHKLCTYLGRKHHSLNQAPQVVQAHRCTTEASMDLLKTTAFPVHLCFCKTNEPWQGWDAGRPHSVERCGYLMRGKTHSSLLSHVWLFFSFQKMLWGWVQVSPNSN